MVFLVSFITSTQVQAAVFIAKFFRFTNLTFAPVVAIEDKMCICVCERLNNYSCTLKSLANDWFLKQTFNFKNLKVCGKINIWLKVGTQGKIEKNL